LRPTGSDGSSLRVLMTGATGFVGRYTLKALLQRGHRIVALARTPERLPRRADGRLCVERGELSRLRDPSLALRPCDVVLHLAGATRPRDVEEYDRVNRVGTRDLVACLARQRWRPRRLIFASSLAAAGPSPPGRPLTEEAASNPCEPYGRSKLEAEEILRSAPFACTLLRVPAVFGPESQGLAPLFRWSSAGLGLVVGDGAQRLSFIYVEDLADALARAVLEGTTDDRRDEPHLYYVAHPRATDLRELWQLAAACHGRRIRLIFLHQKWLLRAASLADGMPAAIFSPDAKIQLAQLACRAGEDFVCDPTRFEHALKWRARVGVEDSLRLSFRDALRGRTGRRRRLFLALAATTAWLAATPHVGSAAKSEQQSERERWV